ncbi:FAD binding domain-containing protein [Bacillus swezeyi]|uniref:FAD binding domain-containing protein n=1 Tax=Bacillus swezeyi TaxID=1925020 RepID=UPI002E1DDD77|nr:FAD binding domain-containing protein [Bacillus swezeyi]
MIPFDFEYYRPASAKEAAQLFQRLDGEGKQPAYVSGDTEHLALGRFNRMNTKAVIDIKEVPECRVFKSGKKHLTIGAALTLTEISESVDFPLLCSAARGVADHAARKRITLGGNICGEVFYREAVLPFLLTDSQVMTLDAKGVNLYLIHDVFNKQLQLNDGEMLLLLLTEKRYLNLPFANIKVRRHWAKGYPLVTIAAIKIDDHVRAAFSGVCPFPFRSSMIEEILNDQQLTIDEKVQQAIRHLPEPILDDDHCSADYLKFVVKHTLIDVLGMLENGKQQEEIEGR